MVGLLNEGFIKVGETVVTGFKQSSDEGVVTCTAEGTAGITFGAKVDKIDDNGFVTFALSRNFFSNKNCRNKWLWYTKYFKC